MNTVWIILFAPLLAASLILFLKRWKALSAALSIGAILTGFVLSVQLFYRFLSLPPELATQLSPTPLKWLVVSNLFTIEFGALIDRLSILMLLVVTGVGSAIHIYSLGYMKEDPSFSRFFACLSLFTFSMLGIVLSNNFIQIFIFWELVGLSSYLLIGFWFHKDSAAEASKKAFLVNRIGDFGFMAGILLIFTYTGHFGFAENAQLIPQSGLQAGMLTLAALLIFCGAMGKSAQFPLHVWLPDAMEGPTPVSALIHAATMVAAGIYMLCRTFFLFSGSETALHVISWIGGITALMAALIAVAQNDIKRILAYSTLSQLGYMVMAVGLGGTTQALFHLTTHAFFKALLFLSAGSVILALHHEQNIWKMGGLRAKTPFTFLAFLIGTLALAGVFPLSGFYSKDEILLLALHHNPLLFAIAILTAFLTSFYMGRELFVVFFGKARDHHTYDHAHESPLVVLLPLAFLGLLSIGAGWFGFLPHFITPEGLPPHHNPFLGYILLLVPASGLGLSALLYLKQNPSDNSLKKVLGPIYKLLENKFYFDELYKHLIRWTQGLLAQVCEFFDLYILQKGAINGLSGGTQMLGWAIRHIQTGHTRFYAFLIGLGLACTLLFLLPPN